MVTPAIRSSWNFLIFAISNVLKSPKGSRHKVYLSYACKSNWCKSLMQVTDASHWCKWKANIRPHLESYSKVRSIYFSTRKIDRIRRLNYGIGLHLRNWRHFGNFIILMIFRWISSIFKKGMLESDLALNWSEFLKKGAA